MGITATIQEIPGGNKVILIAVSVGTDNYKPECFGALVEALLENVRNGSISPDTPCIVLRGCLVQRHTLEFKYNITSEQALSLAISNGEQWQIECRPSLEKLQRTFKSFEIIRWGDKLSLGNNTRHDNKVVQENSNIEHENENFIIKKVAGTVECLGRVLPKYELELTNSYKILHGNFMNQLSDPQNEDLEGLVQAAVDNYCNSFVASKLKNNMQLVLTAAQLATFKSQSRKYVPEDVLILNQTIELIVERFKPLTIPAAAEPAAKLSICFTYPFPHGNVTENATMHVLTNKKVMKPEVNYFLNFPKLFINPGYPVPTAEERKKAKEDKKANREEAKAKAVNKGGEVRSHRSGQNLEPTSGGNSPCSSGTTSPKDVRSGASTPTESSAISPVGSPPRTLNIETAAEKGSTPLTPAAAQTGAATRNDSQNGSHIPSNFGGSSFLLFNSNKGQNSAAPSNAELLKEVSALNQEISFFIPLLALKFPDRDEVTLKRMALMFTLNQDAIIAAEAQLPKRKPEDKPGSSPPGPGL